MRLLSPVSVASYFHLLANISLHPPLPSFPWRRLHPSMQEPVCGKKGGSLTQQTHHSTEHKKGLGRHKQRCALRHCCVVIINYSIISQSLVTCGGSVLCFARPIVYLVFRPRSDFFFPKKNVISVVSECWGPGFVFYFTFSPFLSNSRSLALFLFYIV